LVQLGVDAQRLRSALAAEGVASTLAIEDAGVRFTLAAA
jgi:hypothetical protein